MISTPSLVSLFNKLHESLSKQEYYTQELDVLALAIEQASDALDKGNESVSKIFSAETMNKQGEAIQTMGQVWALAMEKLENLMALLDAQFDQGELGHIPSVQISFLTIQLIRVHFLYGHIRHMHQSLGINSQLRNLNLNQAQIYGRLTELSTSVTGIKPRRGR